MIDNLRTDLAKAKNLGSAKSGYKHWWHQRLTAIILVMFSIWLLFFIKAIAAEPTGYISIISKPYNFVSLIIFSVTAFYHSMLGMQVIIEDYVSRSFWRNFLIIAVQIFCFMTVIALIAALLFIVI